MMKRVIAVAVAVMLTVSFSSCQNRGNPTVAGDYVWENSGQTEEILYDLNQAYTLNYNVADTLAAQKDGVNDERLKLAQDIIAELDKYPESSSDKAINYVIKMRAVYKCVVGFYYMNSTYEQLNSLIAEYNNAYDELSNELKVSFAKIKPVLFTDAAKQFELYGKETSNP